LGQGALTSVRCRSCGGIFIHVLISAIDGAGVQTNQKLHPLRSSRSFLRGDWSERFMIEFQDRIYPQSWSWLRDSRFARCLYTYRSTELPLNPPGQHAQQRHPIGKVDVQGQWDDVVKYKVRRRVVLQRVGSRHSCQWLFRLLRGKSHSNPTGLRWTYYRVTDLSKQCQIGKEGLL
jgi:hypothetical protein